MSERGFDHTVQGEEVVTSWAAELGEASIQVRPAK
jgi:hypothetical protein